jgi:hypothetical protein
MSWWNKAEFLKISLMILAFLKTKMSVDVKREEQPVSHRKVASNQNVSLTNFKSTYKKNALNALKMSRNRSQINWNKMQWGTVFNWSDWGKASEIDNRKWSCHWKEFKPMNIWYVWQKYLRWVVRLHMAHDANVLMKKDIPAKKRKLEDAKYAVDHSSTAHNNGIFTVFMYSKKLNKLKSLQLELSQNALLAPNEVESIPLYLFLE